MARGQGTTGDRRPAPALTVAIRDRFEGEAVLAAAAALGLEIVLVTAPGLARFAGAGFCAALSEVLGRPVGVDCGREPGLALAALRAGAPCVRLEAPAALFARVADIARQLGAELVREWPEPTLRLAPGETPPAALRRAAAERGAGEPSSPAGERL